MQPRALQTQQGMAGLAKNKIELQGDRSQQRLKITTAYPTIASLPAGAGSQPDAVPEHNSSAVVTRPTPGTKIVTLSYQRVPAVFEGITVVWHLGSDYKTTW